MKWNMIRLAMLLTGCFLVISAAVAQQTSIEIGGTYQDQADGSDMSFTVDLSAEQIILIDLESDDFDTLIRVADQRQTVLEEDDDGGEGFNSRLTFTAPEAGTYTLIVTSFAGNPQGAFTLTISDFADPSSSYTTIEYGQTVEIDPQGNTTVSVSFFGEEGDIINLYAVSSTGEDSKIFLYGVSGNEVASDDDGGEGSNPYLRRLMLPETGQYTVDVQGYGESQLYGSLSITLEKTELPIITESGLKIVMSETVQNETVAFEAVAGVSYLFSLKTDQDLESSAYLEFLQENEDYAGMSISISGIQDFSAVFTADATGMVRINISYYSYSDDVIITLNVSPVE